MTSSVVNGWGEVCGKVCGDVFGAGDDDFHGASRSGSGCFGGFCGFGCFCCFGDGFGGAFGGAFGEDSGDGSRRDGAVIGPPPP
jgi:hypothetical protein